MDGLPRLTDLGLDTLPASEDVALADVIAGTDPPAFRLSHVGANLEARAGRCLAGERIGNGSMPSDPIGGAAWAYRRCLETGAPSYEFAYFGLGDGGTTLFERLLLPIGRGGKASHLLVASMFTAAARDPG